MVRTARSAGSTARFGRGGSPTAGRCRGDDGVALLEAALITPIFLLMTLGSLDFGLVYRDYLALNSATSSAARSLAIFGNDAYTDYNVLQAIKKDLAAVPPGNIAKIVVFKADTRSDTSSWASCKTGGSVNGRCNVYTTASWSLNKNLYFGCTPTGAVDNAWCPTGRKIAAADPPDYAGVYIRIVHPYITKFFGSSITLESFVITRLEPQKVTSTTP